MYNIFVLTEVDDNGIFVKHISNLIIYVNIHDVLEED